MEIELKKLPAQFKADWLAALRSGEIEQGVGALCDGDRRMCCIGVACLIAGNEFLESKGDDTDEECFLSNSGHEGIPSGNDLPPEVMAVFRQKHDDFYHEEESVLDILVAMNDRQFMSFNEISNWIEERL